MRCSPPPFSRRGSVLEWKLSLINVAYRYGVVQAGDGTSRASAGRRRLRHAAIERPSPHGVAGSATAAGPRLGRGPGLRAGGSSPCPCSLRAVGSVPALKGAVRIQRCLLATAIKTENLHPRRVQGGGLQRTLGS